VGVKYPVHFCLRISKTVTDAATRLFDIVQELSTRAIYLPKSSVISLTEMSTWWRGNRKYILGNQNQRKVGSLILNLPITIATDIFIDWFHIFMGIWPKSAVCMVSWRQSSPEMQHGWRIDYENRQNMVWNCGTEMFDIHRFWYHVFFSPRALRS